MSRFVCPRCGEINSPGLDQLPRISFAVAACGKCTFPFLIDKFGRCGVIDKTSWEEIVRLGLDRRFKAALEDMAMQAGCWG